jgi:putative membrane protein
MALLRQVEWTFLLPLGGGIALAVVTLSGAIEHALHTYPVPMASLFLGLVAGSVAVAWQLLTVRDALRLAVLAGVGLITFVLLGLRESTSTASAGDAADAATHAPWVFFAAGSVAICAMILPGISGSFLLLSLGMYAPVLAAVNDRDVVSIGSLLLGCIVGLALFSQVLHWALAHHEATVMAALIGLMVGSLRVLWPWPLGVDSTALGAPEGPLVWPLVLMVGGCALVVGVSRFATKIEHRSAADAVEDLRH